MLTASSGAITLRLACPERFGICKLLLVLLSWGGHDLISCGTFRFHEVDLSHRNLVDLLEVGNLHEGVGCGVLLDESHFSTGLSAYKTQEY